eukprot:jgi/Mesvir1/1436/Mv14430-RA.1
MQKFGISGIGSMKVDIKQALQIADTWSTRFSESPLDSVAAMNSVIPDSKMMIPAWVLDDCYGICFLFSLKAGFVFSGEAGTGFVMSKLNRRTPHERWSGPTAVTSGGVGWGLQVGASKTYHCIILNSKQSLEVFSGKAKVNLGGNLGVSLGPVGRGVDATVDLSKGGVAPSYSYSYSAGAYAGISLNGTVVVSNPKMNEKFYGAKVDVQDILDGKQGLDAWRENPELDHLYRALDRAAANARASKTSPAASMQSPPKGNQALIGRQVPPPPYQSSPGGPTTLPYSNPAASSMRDDDDRATGGNLYHGADDGGLFSTPERSVGSGGWGGMYGGNAPTLLDDGAFTMAATSSGGGGAGRKPLAEFSVAEVCQWVSQMGLDSKPFELNAVNGRDLLALDLEDYKELGLTGIMAKKMAREIANYSA